MSAPVGSLSFYFYRIQNDFIIFGSLVKYYCCRGSFDLSHEGGLAFPLDHEQRLPSSK